MSNALAIGPAVMINRIADRAGTPLAAKLGMVAELRMDLMIAVDDQQAKAAAASPSGEAQAMPPTNGAEVDRLV